MGCGNIGSGGGVRRRQNNELRPGRIKKEEWRREKPAPI